VSTPKRKAPGPTRTDGRLAKLERELAEALEQQTATANVLKTISRSAFDLPSVLDTVVENAARLCGADAAWTSRVEGDEILVPALASYGTDAQGRALDETLERLISEDAASEKPRELTVRGLRHRLSMTASSIIARPLAERRAVLSDDITTDASLATSRFALRIGVRSVLGVPLIREGTPIGVMVLARHQVRPFSDREKQLAETFADQAAIAIENVRLFNETKEALEHQRAIAEILEVVSRSPDDVQPVLDAIVASAARLTDADSSAIFRADGDEMTVTAARQTVLAQAGNRFRVDGRTVPAAAFRIGATLHVEDVSRHPEYPQGPPLTRLAVPIPTSAGLYGAIIVGRREVRPFSARQIELIETFARQAGIAIENVRLFNETKEALGQQSAIADVLKTISRSAFDLKPVLDNVVESAARLCSADAAWMTSVEGDVMLVPALAIFGIDGQGRPLGPELEQLVISDTLVDLTGPEQVPTVAGPRRRLTIGRSSIIARPAAERRSVVSDDITTDPTLAESRFALRIGVRSALGVPMIREGTPIGVLVLARHAVRPFSQREIQLAETFADQAAIAIENVRLFNETKEALAQQTATSEVLQSISRSAFDLDAVLRTVLDRARDLCQADHAMVIRSTPAGLRMVAYSGSSAVLDEQVGRQVAEGRPYILGPGDEEALSGRRSVQHTGEELASEVERFPRGFTSRTGSRSRLCVPLLRADETLGLVVLGRLDPNGFSPRDIALVETFADQAVIAMENVRLFNETQEALEQQTATSEILKVISRSPTDTQPVFDAIVRAGLDLFPGSAVAVALHDGSQVRAAAIAETEAPERADQWKRRFPFPLSREYMHGAAILDRKVLDVPDVAALSEEYEAGAKNFLGTGYRAITIMPMVRGDAAIGAISVIRPRAGALSEKQLSLLTTFADQAVIAIENVRLFNETKESLEQQTAVAEILKTISRSAFDLRPVLETLVEQAARLCEADHGSIHRWDGSAYRTAAFWGPDLTDDYKQVAFSQPRPPARDTLIGRTGLTRDVVHITDVLADPEYAPRDLQSLGGYRTVLGVPLIRDGFPIGVFGLMRNHVKPFTDRQIELVRTFADQAAIAMENVRLFNETKEALEQQTAVSEVLKTISHSAFDLEAVLGAVVENAARLCGAEGAWISSVEGDQLVVPALARYGTDAQGQPISDLMMGGPSRTITVNERSIMSRPVVLRTTVAAEDLSADPTLSDSRFALRIGTRSVLAVPLMREGRPIGVFVLARYTVRPFSDREIQLAETFADQAAIAIENVRLFSEIQQKSHELEVASRHKSEFLANMSHELRTPLNAIIGFTDVMLQQMFGPLNEKQSEYLEDVRDSGTHLLSLINDILDLSKIEAGRVELETSRFSLAEAIDNALTLVRERASHHGITLAADIAPDVGTIAADERKLKQIVVNLLTNAVKFTPDGGWVGISARCDGDDVHVAVRDTGIGIAPEDQDRVFEEFQQVGKDPERSREGTGLGLTLSKRFVELQGGRIWVESEVGKGSTFSFTIPVRQTAAAPAGALGEGNG
jgi:GAF domain-containing protein/anti-sigma regulatory factor (Ser/Thr protein kinase)